MLFQKSDDSVLIQCAGPIQRRADNKPHARCASIAAPRALRHAALQTIGGRRILRLDDIAWRTASGLMPPRCAGTGGAARASSTAPRDETVPDARVGAAPTVSL